MNHKLSSFLWYSAIVLTILLAFIGVSVLATADTGYQPIITSDLSLSATVFATDGTTTMDAELIDGRLHVSASVHGVKNLRVLESMLVNRLKGYNGKEVMLYHVNDAGVKDSSRLIQIQSDGTWTYFYDVEFSEIIIDGFVGTWEVTAYNLSVSDSLNFGQTFNTSNVTSLSVNVTDDATKEHPYDINTTGLVGWWKLDDDYTDSSGNGNNGTAYGDTYFMNIKYENGSSFDANGDYIEIPNDVTLTNNSSIYINVWIMPQSITGEKSIIEKGFLTSYQLETEGDEIKVKYNIDGNTDNMVSEGLDLEIGRLYNIEVILESGRQQIYVNNILQSGGKILTGLLGIDNNTLRIGDRRGILFFNGSIDNLLIYNRVPSLLERNDLYYDHLQQLKIKTNSNSTWSSEWNSSADNLIQVPYTDGEFFSLLNFTVPDTVVQNGITIYDYPSTVQLDAVATVGYTKDITKTTESAATGTYALNGTHAAGNTGEGYINYTTANNVLLDADFWNAAVLTTDNPNATLSTTLPYFNISTGYVAATTEYYYLIEQDYFYPPTGLSSITDVNQINFDWDDYANVDYWNISRLDITIPFTSAYAVLDGIKDACYTCCCAYGFVGDAPNPYTTHGKETIYILRNNTYLILYADGEDDDNFNNDDNFIVGIDASNNNLTTDDRKFILKEGGTVTAKRWSGSAWNPVATTATGVVVGGGTAGAIQYEMFIPVSEFDTNFTNGSTVKFFMSRTHTASNPDVESYYPQTLQNDTDATLWQSVLLSSEPQYTYIDNTTISEYTVTGLDPFTWYQHQFTAINGSQETTGTNSVDITLDTPSYTISGYIKDSSGNPIANVDVWGENGYPLEHNVSNASGYYIGTHFHNGTYTIYANATNTIQNSIPITVSGANLTNQNITLNYYNFSYTGISCISPIYPDETSTVWVDVTDPDGTIQAVTVKIDGTNYSMHVVNGNQWGYIYSDTSEIKKHYITNFYAWDDQGQINSTTSTLYIDVTTVVPSGARGIVYEVELPELELIPVTVIGDERAKFVINLAGLYNFIIGEEPSEFIQWLSEWLQGISDYTLIQHISEVGESKPFWYVIGSLSLCIFLSGVTDKNPKIKAKPAATIGFVGVLISSIYLGLFAIVI